MTGVVDVMRRYGFAVLSTAAAVLLLIELRPLVHPFVGSPLLVAVVASALVGGIGPGLLASLLGLVALNYWFFPPIGGFAVPTAEDIFRQTIYLSTAVLVALVGGLARQGRRRAQAEARESEGLGLAAAKAAAGAQAAAEALRLSEARLRLTQAAAGIGLWEWEPASGRTTYSPEYFPLYGLSPDAPPPSIEFWRDRLLHPEDRDRLVADVEAALAGSRSYDTEFRVVWPDGTVRWLAARGQVIRDEAGQPVRMVGVNFDVTARRTLEERLRQIDRLETVGRLAGGVAHEANNQMTVVLGAANFVLGRDDLPSQVRADIETVVRAAERTARITGQLLAFGRRQVLAPDVLDLNALIGALQPMLRRTLGQDVVLHLDLARDLARVEADRGKLDQVLLELALNARDAMPQGGALTLRTRNVTLDEGFAGASGVAVQTGAYAAIEVSDTGRGMDAETLSHAFDPFFTTKPVGLGTGLGLATVYGIVKQSSGYIFAESEPGRGTAFTIYLRAVLEPYTAAVPVEPVPPGRGETVLVVETDPEVRAVIARLLRETGYAAMVAEDAQGALRAMQVPGVSPDLVITAVIMPGLNGLHLAERVADLRPAIPVLLMSGQTDHVLVQRALRENRFPLLLKPIVPEILIRKVRELLDTAHERAVE